jgi:hypothetical protein
LYFDSYFFFFFFFFFFVVVFFVVALAIGTPLWMRLRPSRETVRHRTTVAILRPRFDAGQCTLVEVR